MREKEKKEWKEGRTNEGGGGSERVRKTKLSLCHEVHAAVWL